MLTARKKIEETLQTLYSAEEIKSIYWQLMGKIRQKTRTELLTEWDYALSTDERNLLNQMITRLQQEEPLQYVLGECEFAGQTLHVAPGVLIPRPETEELVHQIIQAHQHKQSRILDIGCGSGCIAISLAAHLPLSQVSAWDISNNALHIARQNAVVNHVTVYFEQKDILHDEIPDKEWDIIVSNPPYVLEKEKESMQNNVLRYEPHEALFVPDHDPLRFYRRITEIARQHLSAHHGSLYFEINESYGPETVALLKEAGFKHVELIRDFLGKERFVKAIR